MTHKLTKQGVRDLDAGRPKPTKPKPIDLPPSQFCEHKRARTDPLTGDRYCPDCGRMWDWNGNE